MIDIINENLIPLREVPKHLPPRPTGRRIHISVVYRWITRGLGGIRLESVKIGGTTYTSKEALQRFADQRSTAKHDSSTSPRMTTLTRQKQIDQSSRKVKLILGSKRTNKRFN